MWQPSQGSWQLPDSHADGSGSNWSGGTVGNGTGSPGPSKTTFMAIITSETGTMSQKGGLSAAAGPSRVLVPAHGTDTAAATHVETSALPNATSMAFITSAIRVRPSPSQSALLH